MPPAPSRLASSSMLADSGHTTLRPSTTGPWLEAEPGSGGKTAESGVWSRTRLLRGGEVLGKRGRPELAHWPALTPTGRAGTLAGVGASASGPGRPYTKRRSRSCVPRATACSLAWSSCSSVRKARTSARSEACSMGQGSREAMRRDAPVHWSLASRTEVATSAATSARKAAKRSSKSTRTACETCCRKSASSACRAAKAPVASSEAAESGTAGTRTSSRSCSRDTSLLSACRPSAMSRVARVLCWKTEGIFVERRSSSSPRMASASARQLSSLCSRSLSSRKRASTSRSCALAPCVSSRRCCASNSTARSN
mmetsp:Transcript_4422/g.13472  ORF Transcript_4422/g.13472 Transcript_4422/m.13472 type:complete len:312 (+) Transcript_4422:501-1436(+)